MDDAQEHDTIDRQARTICLTAASVAGLLVAAVLHRCAPHIGWIATCAVAAMVGGIIASDVILPIGTSSTQRAIEALDDLLGENRAEREHHLRVIIYLLAIIVVACVTDVMAGR